MTADPSLLRKPFFQLCPSNPLQFQKSNQPAGVVVQHQLHKDRLGDVGQKLQIQNDRPEDHPNRDLDQHPNRLKNAAARSLKKMICLEVEVRTTTTTITRTTSGTSTTKIRIPLRQVQAHLQDEHQVVEANRNLERNLKAVSASASI